MLQQTQVNVVIPYFQKWMQHFPTITHLAKAQIEEVLKLWEGLGYYSRARHLHEAARFLVDNHHGELPSDRETLAKIKGIGPYTLGAILGFAFQKRAAAIDGNVMRVLARFFAIEEPVDLPKTKKKIAKLAEQVLPHDEPWQVSEGLIELGATICMKKAICGECPLKKGCLSYRNHLQEEIPKKQGKIKITHLKRDVAVVTCKGLFLVYKNKPGAVMADLYEFPYISHQRGAIISRFTELLELSLDYLQSLPEQDHTFTRFRVKLFPHLMRTDYFHPNHEWKTQKEIESLPFSSGHRKILNTLFFEK